MPEMQHRYVLPPLPQLEDMPERSRAEFGIYLRELEQVLRSINEEIDKLQNPPASD